MPHFRNSEGVKRETRIKVPARESLVNRPRISQDATDGEGVLRSQAPAAAGGGLRESPALFLRLHFRAGELSDGAERSLGGIQAQAEIVVVKSDV
jgi:hypothetical protein